MMTSFVHTLSGHSTDGSGSREQRQPGRATAPTRQKSALRGNRTIKTHVHWEVCTHEHHSHQQERQKQHEGKLHSKQIIKGQVRFNLLLKLSKVGKVV